MRVLALATLFVAQVAGASCIPLDAPCAHTISRCCDSDAVCSSRMTGGRCVLANATTTTTTTTEPGATTTTTPPTPGNPDYSFLFLPADLAPTLAQPPGITGHLVDPRTGLPANQPVLATMGWQYEAFSMQLVALADLVGCPFNEQQIINSNFKFGADYVLLHQSYPSGGTYQWLSPTYVRQYALRPIVDVAPCLAAHGVLPAALAQIAGLEPGPTSPPPLDLDTTILDGVLTYTPNHYPPLTPAQCAALAAAEAAHMAHDQALLDHDFALAEANNAAVAAAQRAFEGTADDIDQAVLFKWVWIPDYNRGNPQDVLDGLTAQIMDAHMQVTAAYHCDTHESPDVPTLEHFMLKHNLLHDYRATTHWLDRPTQTVCDETEVQSCPRLTVRQQASQ